MKGIREMRDLWWNVSRGVKTTLLMTLLARAGMLSAVEEVLLAEPTHQSKYNFACCVSFADAADGRILATLGERLVRSDDGGRTWVDQAQIPLGTRNLLRLKNGRLMSLAVVGGEARPTYFVEFSDDDGLTWCDRAPLCLEKRMMWIMNNRLIQLSSGRILVTFSRHPESLKDRQGETVGWVNSFYSDDDGKTWTEGKILETTVADQLCEPCVFECSDGKLKMFSRTGMGFLYQCESTDGGHTWSVERPTTLRSPVSPFCVRRDPYSGYVFAVWNNSFPAPNIGSRHQFPRCPLCLAVSRDEGQTWDFICELGNDPMSGYGYPAIHFTKDSLLIAHYHERGIRHFVPAEQATELKILKRSELTRDVVTKVPLWP